MTDKKQEQQIEKLKDKIEELIKDCPKNWAELAAEKTGKANSTIGRIRRGELGKRDGSQQIELINALKSIKEDHENEFNKAIAS